MSSLAIARSVLKSTFSSKEQLSAVKQTTNYKLKMAKIALIFFLFALVAVCMCARVPREEPAKTELETQLNELLAKAKEIFSEDNVKDFQDKAKAAAAEGLAAFQKLSNSLNEQIQQSPKP